MRVDAVQLLDEHRIRSEAALVRALRRSRRANFGTGPSSGTEATNVTPIFAGRRHSAAPVENVEAAASPMVEPKTNNGPETASSARLPTAVGIAIGMALAGILVGAGLWGGVLGTKAKIDRIEAYLPALRKEISVALREQERQTALLHAEWRQFRRPPSVFTEAGDLMRARRWADAEAAYGRFLAEHPNSRLEDIALKGAAIAAAMAGSCGLAASRLATLKRKFPRDGTQADRIVQECRIRAQERK